MNPSLDSPPEQLYHLFHGNEVNLTTDSPHCHGISDEVGLTKVNLQGIRQLAIE